MEEPGRGPSRAYQSPDPLSLYSQDAAGLQIGECTYRPSGRPAAPNPRSPRRMGPLREILPVVDCAAGAGPAPYDRGEGRGPRFNIG